jgi:Secretion system C-terminal sorting domain/Glycine rich protein/Ig-like domain CHU_C associated
MKKTLLLLLLSLCFLFVHAQNEVTIGTGTATSFYAPIYISSATSSGLWSNHISIFTPAEINAANVPLSGFSWDKADTEGYTLGNAEYRIYVKHTSSTSIPTTSGTFATELAGATLVYESTSQNIPLAAGWVDFDFNTANSFIYNGTDNLMILVDWYRPGAPSGGVYWNYTATGTMAQSWSGPATPPTFDFGTGYRPNIKIRYVGTPNVTPSSITMNCGDTATFTASGSTGFYQWYSDSLGQNIIGSDSILQLGPLCSDATVYVASLDNELFNFTNCGVTGFSGPTQTDVNTAYASTNLNGDVTINTQGIQEWTVPQTGVYTIDVSGAQGGGDNGGLGANMQGDFMLTAGDVLKILVGQEGTTADLLTTASASGGGGSFVTLFDNTPLIIAGGGGGNQGTAVATSHGDILTSGQTGYGASSVGAGGISGNGGTASPNSGGGGGLLTNGTTGANGGPNEGGLAFLNGGEGGDEANGNLSYPTASGGFGGGGTATNTGWRAGGGGGGYSGGGGGNVNSVSSDCSGGGGGSYNNGTNQNNIAGINTGHGSISITRYGTGLTSPLGSAQITIVPISDPIVTSPISICEMDSVLLTATGSTGNYLWSADSIGNTLLENGSSYQTGAILSDTVFYVQAYSDSINQTYSFTNCAATGSTGPTQANVDAAYSTNILNGNVNITTQGIQEWIVPNTAIYTIEAYGAQGGAGNSPSPNDIGGKGAYMSGEFSLTKGDTLMILVGQQGLGYGDATENTGGGGGGTFVATGSSLATTTPLIIAGGGGGTSPDDFPYSVGMDAPITQNGTLDREAGSVPGINGNGGEDGCGTGGSNVGGGGAGFYTDGINLATSASQITQGFAFVNGGEGGANTGGFGGGGGNTYGGNYNISASGGGGYSGGAGGNRGCMTTSSRIGGGAGGSYNAGINQNNTAGINTGHGYVTIKVYAPLCFSSIIPVNVITDTLPEITTQAVNAAVVEGSNASFTITATGTALNYQWQESTDSSTSWTNLVNNATYSGVTTATLTITSTTIAMDNYYYRCLVDGTCSPADTSNNAILEVQVSGINSYAINCINVYPNPVENTLIIEIDSKIEDNANLSIYDIIGNAILEYPDISITIGVNRIPVDMQTLAKGVYYLRVLIGQEQLQYSIIKK